MQNSNIYPNYIFMLPPFQEISSTFSEKLFMTGLCHLQSPEGQAGTINLILDECVYKVNISKKAAWMQGSHTCTHCNFPELK